MKLSSLCGFLQSKYLPPHLIIRHPQPMLYNKYKKPNLSIRQNKNQNYITLYLTSVFLESKREDRMFCAE